MDLREIGYEDGRWIELAQDQRSYTFRFKNRELPK
jgi:hypothetical protein